MIDCMGGVSAFEHLHLVVGRIRYNSMRLAHGKRHFELCGATSLEISARLGRAGACCALLNSNWAARFGVGQSTTQTRLS